MTTVRDRSLTLQQFLALPEVEPALEYFNGNKCRWFAANGVTIALLVNDRTETITRFGSDGTERRLAKGDRIDLDQVLPGFALTVQALFDTLQIDPPRNHRG